METAIKPRTICNPFEPLIGANEPDEMQDLNLRLYEVWKLWERYGTNRDWLDNFENISLDMLQKSCSWYEIGLVSYQIKIRKSYQSVYQSFRDFCEKSLQKTAACVNNWIRAANVLSELIARGFDILPLSCSVSLELSKVKTDIGDVWQTLIDRFPIHQITAKTVKEYGLDPLQEKPKMKGIKLPQSQWDRIHDVASQAGISPSRMLERILNHYLGEGKNDGGSTTGQTQDNIQREQLETREAQEERITPNIEASQKQEANSHSGDTVSQVKESSQGNLSQNSQKSRGFPPIHVASDLKQREEKATKTIREIRDEYRKNPIKREIPLPGRKPKCIECDSDSDLIGCMNMVNLSRVPDFWYCQTHIGDSGYCPQCGRHEDKCACDF